jgi:DNA-binding GntR family transcriptional regulator
MATDRDSLNRRTTSEVVAARLRQEILRGELEPGTRLRQGALAERFGVSTTPVREAFALLQADGLVRIDAHRGAVVFRPSRDEVREFYEIREVLETLAVSLALPHLDDTRLDALQELIDEMRTSVDDARWEELNQRFHLDMYRVSGRERLCSMIANLRDGSSAYIHMFVAHQGPGERADDEHQRILDACRARDAAKARAAVREHMRHTVKAVIAYLDETSPEPAGAHD